ncbi:ATP-binding cassette domain-containing protein [Nocardioides sp. dk4132]|uniref:ABC transporter ATP-binding protein n=1 Tax=unclassified Nocardioides TaxID=2615069 RepID=UPI001295D5D9|nr:MULTISPECIES: ABC transporter ATP-binding protein [unclassified Nocardioides]MQW75842.1 ATP-binding cassette domain-containing protein [Nocardioides sp. dk4132]QGA08712.1 ATP-binding cassette domain-containing protein [Nocardioides sp. dk884]
MSLLSPALRRSPAATSTSVTAAGGADALPLRFAQVGRSFGSGSQARAVLRGIDLEIAPGEVVALLGPSGCGKSTLLRGAAGLDTPTTGQVLIADTPVRAYDERCAVAFQEPRLLPWRTLRANVALGLPAGTDRRAGAARVQELLELVGLADQADLRPREVSGGMAQRTSLARALARRPGVLLLDEPFGALDALTRLKMQDLLLAVHGGSPTTVLLVTHDVDEALQLADRVVVLGRTGDDPAASVSQLVPVPGVRPRDRGSVELAALRSRLLESLGVDAHRH